MVFIGKALQYGLFYLMIGAVVLSFCGKKEGTKEFLGVSSTKELKGIAILMVLMGHLTYMMGYMTMPVTPVLGAPAVDIFLCLSAFGLLHSYTQKGLHHFVKRRLAVILIPYFVVTLCKIPFLVGMMEQSTSDIVLNFLLLSVSGDTTMWYIQYVLIWYLFFFLIFSIPNCNIKTKGLIIGVVGIALFLGNGYLYYQNKMPIGLPLVESYSHHLSFPLGIFLYFIYDKIKNLSKLQYAIAAGTAFIIFQFLAYPGVDGYLKYYVNNISYLIFFVALYGFITKLGRCSNLLNWIGEHAYYIYLYEYMVIQFFAEKISLPNGVKAVMIVISSIVLAIPTKWVCEKRKWSNMDRVKSTR